jgi:hypothetical protein
MSAEIIQFGSPHPAIAQQMTGATRQRRAALTKEIVRFMFNGKLYQVELYGGDVQHFFEIRYRISGGGIQEMKHREWLRDPDYYSTRIDPEFVGAARRARASGQRDADIPFRERALAQLHKRRAKLVREVEMIDATIASMVN